jgi:hypothetical protein
MGMQDALAHQELLQRRAAACAQAGFTIQAVVWTMGADMCRAAAWAAQYGAFGAELRVRYCFPAATEAEPGPTIG